MENNNPMPKKGEGSNSDHHPRVSLGKPSNMPLPSPQPSSNRVHSLFYGDGGSSAVFRPPAAVQLPTTVTTASVAVHLPVHHNSSQSYSESNLLNSYLRNHQQQQQQLEHQKIQDQCPAVQSFSTKASDVNIFTVSGNPSFIEQRNSQFRSTSSNNHSNIVNETNPLGQYFPPNSNSNNLFISSGLSQESFSISNTTASAVKSQSNLQSLMPNSGSRSSGRHLPDIRQIIRNTSPEYNDSIASSRNSYSSSVSNPSGSSISFVNNLSNSSTSSQFVDQSIGGEKSTHVAKMHATKFVARLNRHQVLSSLPSSSRIEAPIASARQSFTPIGTSSMPISRSTSATVSSHSMSHSHNALPFIMSSTDHNSNSNNSLNTGHHSKDTPTSHSHTHSSTQNQNAPFANRFADPFVSPLPVNTTANLPGSRFRFRQVNVDFPPISALGTDNDAPQLIPELLLEPNEAHPVLLEEPSASGAGEPNACIFAPRGMFQTDDEECLVSSSTERALESEFDVEESRMGSSSNPTLPLLDSTVDSTGDPTPLECLDSTANVYAASPVDSNSSSIDDADTDLVSSVRYPCRSIISASSLKNIALASFPPKSLDSDSSDDDNHHMNAVNFPARNHHRFSSSPLKPYQASSSRCQHPKPTLSPSSSTFSAFTNPSSAGPSHRGGLQQKLLPVDNKEEEPEHMDDDSSSQDSVEGVASSLELGLASAGHGLGCSDSVARSTPLLPPAQILERETPSPPLSSSHDGANYQHDLREYSGRLPSIDTGIDTNSESSLVDLGSETSGFLPVRASLHSRATARQYQICSVEDSTPAACTSRRLPLSVSYTTIHDYTVTGAPVICTSSAGSCSSDTFLAASAEYASPNIRKRSKLGSMPTEIAMSESAHFLSVGTNAGSPSVTDPENNWSDTENETDTSMSIKQNGVNCTINNLLHPASSLSARVSLATTSVTSASSKNSPRISSTRLRHEKIIDTSIPLNFGKRNRSMFDGTVTESSDMHSYSSNKQQARFDEQGTKSAEILHGSDSATCNAASSSAIHETISNDGLFSPIVSHVSLSQYSVPFSTCSNPTASSPNVDSYGYMSDSGSLLVSSVPNLSYTSASDGDGVVIGSNTHSLFHPPVVVKTHAATTYAITSSIKDSSSRSFEVAPTYSHCSKVTTLPKKVLVSTLASLARSAETSGSNESFSNSSVAKSVSTGTPFSDAQCSVRQSFFKPIPTPSILSFNKDDCYLKADPEDNSPLISYEIRFDSNSFSSFSNEDYLPIIPSSALSPSAPCATNSRFAISFDTDVPDTQSQPINFSSMPTVDATIHTPERHGTSSSKLGSSSNATLNLSGVSQHSNSSSLSPLTLSFNSSNSLLGNSFEIFPSGHSFTEIITSQQATNTPAAETTTYTGSSSSLKRDLVEGSDNPAYAKSKNFTASYSRQAQGIAVPSVDTESDVSRNADDYDQTMLDHMRMIGDAYENQGGSSSTNSYSSQVVDQSIEEVTSDDHRQQTLKHEGKRHQPADVSAIERSFGLVSVAVVESLTDRSTNIKSGISNSLLASDVDQASFSSSGIIRGASYSVEQHQSHDAELGRPGLQHQKPDPERHAKSIEEVRDQHCDLLPRRHGDKSEMGQLPAQKGEAQVKEEKEHCSSPDGVGPRDRAARRAIKRPRASPQPCSDEVCRECVESGEACTLHDVESITDGHSISDRTILSRAWASLPSQHLSIRQLPASNRDARQYGVISKRRLEQHTFFGPLVGVAKPDGLPSDTSQKTSISCCLKYKFTSSTGEVMVLDTSDMESSNWMSFVGAASTLAQQNCVVIEREDSDLYFYTTRSIPPAAQLRVGYSKQYAAKYGFQSLQATPQEIQAAEERDSWPCYECDARLASSADLQQHLSTHEVSEPPKRKSRARSRLTLKRRRKAEARQGSKAGKRTPAPEQSSVRNSPLRGPADGAPALLSCLVCDKTFTNSKVLALHQLLHGRLVSGVQQQLAEALSCPQCFQVHDCREELLAHVESHVVPPTELRHRREVLKDPPASIASAAGDSTERPLDSPALCAPVTAPSAEDASVELGSEPAPVTKLYDCPICREEMLSLQQLRAHLPHHMDERGRYHCPTCGRDFDSYRKVRRHIRAYCFNVLHCTECNRPFPSVVKLKMHMLTHSDRRDFKCDLCESSFRRKDKLRDHQKRVHGPNNTRPTRPIISLPSVVTKKDKALVSDAEAHRYRNSAYQCRLCLLGFKRRGMLVNHTLKRHPEVALSGVPDLNKPLQSSTMEYHCPHCSKVYRSNIRRNLHMSKGHPGKQPLPPNALVTKPSPTLSSDTGCEGGPAFTDPPRYAVRCKWCHREYLTQAKLNQHHRKYHRDKLLPPDNQPTHLQQQEQMPTGAANVIEVASGSSLYEEIKLHKSWDQPIISYYVDNNNVARQLELNGKVNGVMQTEHVVYNSDPGDGGGDSRSATNALSNDDMASKFNKTKGLGTGDLLTQAMGVICLDMNNATVASASAGNMNTLVNGRIVHTVEDDAQTHKHHSTESSAGHIMLSGGEGTLNNGVILAHPVPSNQNVSAPTPVTSMARECEQQQNVLNAKASSGELVTWTLLSPDSGNTYTIALPPGQLIQLAPNVVATSNTSFVVNEGVAYSTLVPVSR